MKKAIPASNHLAVEAEHAPNDNMLYELRRKGGKMSPKNGDITAAADINFSNEKHKFAATGATAVQPPTVCLQFMLYECHRLLHPLQPEWGKGEKSKLFLGLRGIP